DLYLNKRAEMYHLFDEWLKDGPVELPNDDDMKADIAAIPTPIETSNGKLKFAPKEEIRKNFGRSTDIHDSLVLMFAYPVRSRDVQQTIDERQRKQMKDQQSEISTLNRIRGDEGESPIGGALKRRENWGGY